MLDLLERIEDVPGTCAIAFSRADDHLIGEFLVSQGQVCMITQGLGQVPLGVRLRQSHPAAADAVHKALIRARIEGRPLGAVLDALGAVQSSRIREALLDQFADALATIAAAAPAGLLEATRSAPERRLSSVLSSFPAVEIYWRTIAVLAPRVPDAAATGFDELADESEIAILLARAPSHDGAPLVIAARGFKPTKVAEIAQLGRLVQQVVCSPALLAAGQEPQLIFISGADDGMIGVVTSAQIALLTGLSAASRARALGRLRQLTETPE